MLVNFHFIILLAFTDLKGISMVYINYGTVYRFSTPDGYSWSNSGILRPGDSSPSSNDRFGSSLSAHKNVIAIGDYQHESFTGIAYIFRIGDSGQLGSASTKLSPTTDGSKYNTKGSYYGFDVAVSENHVIVSAPRQNNLKGVVYSYSVTDGSWSLDQKLLPQGDIGNYFGWSIAIHESTLMVGITEYDSGSGRVLVYTSSFGQWTLETTLKPYGADVILNSCFGYSLDLYAYNAVVGTVDVGAVYIFSSIATGGGLRYWTQIAKLLVAEDMHGTRPVTSVAMYGSSVLVGLVNDGSMSGRAYVYTSVGAGAFATWSQQSSLSPRSWDNVAGFGSHVAMDNNWLAVCSTVPGKQGMLYLYSSGSSSATGSGSSGSWSLEALISSPSDATAVGFASGVALHGNTVFATSIASLELVEQPVTYSKTGEVLSLVTSLVVGFLFTLTIGLLALKPSLLRKIIHTVRSKIDHMNRFRDDFGLPMSSERRDLMDGDMDSTYQDKVNPNVGPLTGQDIYRDKYKSQLNEDKIESKGGDGDGDDNMFGKHKLDDRYVRRGNSSIQMTIQRAYDDIPVYKPSSKFLNKPTTAAITTTPNINSNINSTSGTVPGVSTGHTITEEAAGKSAGTPIAQVAKPSQAERDKDRVSRNHATLDRSVHTDDNVAVRVSQKGVFLLS